jgi:hypothetical protein
MRRAFFHRGDAGLEVVEAFDCLVQGHGRKMGEESKV